MKLSMIAPAVLLCFCVSQAQDVSGSAGSSGPRPRLAILDLTAHNAMPDDDIEAVTKRVYAEMQGTGRYEIIDRAALQNALGGPGTAQTQCAQTSCAAQIGRAAGADQVLVGNVTKVDVTYELTLKIVDVARALFIETHVEKVAGNMGDVAQVGVLCAVRALLAEKKGPEYQQGDWHKVRAHGMGVRLSVVLSKPYEDRYNSRISLSDAIPMLPTVGGGLHYDARFRMKSGAEIRYTPSVEFWLRQGAKSGGMKRLTELQINVADFRYFFKSTVETKCVFYLGLGPGLALDFIYDQNASKRYPPDSTYITQVKFAANVMAGIEWPMGRGAWTSMLGFKVKFWNPTVFQLSYGLTRPFGKGRYSRGQEKTAQPASGESSPTRDSLGE